MYSPTPPGWCVFSAVCVCVLISVSVSPVDILSADITGRRLLSDSRVNVNPLERRKPCMVCAQVNEFSDECSMTDDKTDVIANRHPLRNSQFLVSRD